jgi:prephenate dehydrogenase
VIIVQEPEIWSLAQLSTTFRISREAVKRILSSKFTPTSDIIERQEANRLRSISNYMEEEKRGQKIVKEKSVRNQKLTNVSGKPSKVKKNNNSRDKIASKTLTEYLLKD